MLEEVKKAIEEIYLNGNRDLFISNCKKDIGFLNDLLEILKTEVLNFDICANSSEPMIEIRFSVNCFKHNDGEVKYVSILMLNKIVDCFYLQHEFSLNNPDPDGMDSHLDGFRDEAYSKKQFDLGEKIISYLKSKGYKRLSYADMEEVFPGIRKCEDRDDTNQMTVNNALFMDVWNLCNSN